MSRLKLRRFRVQTPTQEVLARHCLIFDARTLHFEADRLPMLDAPTLFGDARPLYLDLGSGRGESLISLAQSHPRAGIIGIERHWKSVYDSVNKIEAGGYDNVKIVRADLRWVFKRIASNSVQEAFLLFPPPRLEENREGHDLLNWERINDIHRVLVPGGRFYFVTDNETYFEERVANLIGSMKFELELAVERFEGGQTAFQKRWERYGITSKRAELRVLK